jgi:phospholipid transport system substrate-binding protein
MIWPIHKAMTRVSAAVLSITFLLTAGVALASTPNEEVERQTQAVAEVLAQPESDNRTMLLATTVDEAIDFPYLASLALGEHWERRTEAEREEFLTLLRRLLLANYEDRLGGYQLDEDYTVEFEEGRQRGERAFVAAEITHKDRVEPVVYRLYRDADGDWQIYDLVVDDISLEETYREGYVPIIEDHGWEELIRRMQSRVDQLEE